MSHLLRKTAFVALLAPLLALAAPSRQVTLADVQETLALPELEATTNLVTISDGTNSVAFHPGFRRAAVNGVAVWLNEPAEPDYKNTLRLGRPDLERLLAPILDFKSQISDSELPPQSALVFLDPGHGGEDCGAISAATGQQEKDLVLDISLRLGALLQDAGVAVAYSRTNDTFVSLSDRAALAATNNATLFVSIHANTTGNASAQGIETFTLSFADSDSTSGDTRISKKEWPGNAFDATNAVLGYLVQASVNTARGEADRGLRHARFQVLRQAPCPAVLVECGFLSNKAEDLSLESPRYRQRIAAAIARAILLVPPAPSAPSDNSASPLSSPANSTNSTDSANPANDVIPANGVNDVIPANGVNDVIPANPTNDVNGVNDVNDAIPPP